MEPINSIIQEADLPYWGWILSKVIDQIIKTGESLHTDEILKSQNKKFVAKLNEKGELCIYYKNPDFLLWTSKNNKTGVGPFRATVQDDSNFVIYDANNLAIWHSSTWKKDAIKGNYLKLCDDGNLVLYDKDDKVVWQANSQIRNVLKAGQSLSSGEFLKAEIASFFVAFDNKGQICNYASEYLNEDNVIWSSGNSSGHGPYKLTIQDDGNLVIHDADNKSLWVSNAVNKGGKGYYATVLEDGNLVIYDGNNTLTWASYSSSA